MQTVNANAHKSAYFQKFFVKFKTSALPKFIIPRLIPIKFETLKLPTVMY
jgi:hypothetical protein